MPGRTDPATCQTSARSASAGAVRVNASALVPAYLAQSISVAPSPNRDAGTFPFCTFIYRRLVACSAGQHRHLTVNPALRGRTGRCTAVVALHSRPSDRLRTTRQHTAGIAARPFAWPRCSRVSCARAPGSGSRSADDSSDRPVALPSRGPGTARAPGFSGKRQRDLCRSVQRNRAWMRCTPRLKRQPDTAIGVARDPRHRRRRPLVHFSASLAEASSGSGKGHALARHALRARQLSASPFAAICASGKRLAQAGARISAHSIARLGAAGSAVLPMDSLAPAHSRSAPDRRAAAHRRPRRGRHVLAAPPAGDAEQSAG